MLSSGISNQLVSSMQIFNNSIQETNNQTNDLLVKTREHSEQLTLDIKKDRDKSNNAYQSLASQGEQVLSMGKQGLDIMAQRELSKQNFNIMDYVNNLCNASNKLSNTYSSHIIKGSVLKNKVLQYSKVNILDSLEIRKKAFQNR